MNTANNKTQSELISQLTNLVYQLNIFIHGDADAVVVTKNGLVKSIAGITKDISSFRYIQKIIDHRLYSDMIVDDIENGILIRIWGDSPSINGIYKKTIELGFIKISYSDIYDLSAPAKVDIGALLLDV